jgi:excisionase family DNA binding protein
MARSITIVKKAQSQAPDRPVAPRSLQLLTIREAAEYARVSTQTVRRWIQADELKIYRAGRQIRIDLTDLVQFLS